MNFEVSLFNEEANSQARSGVQLLLQQWQKCSTSLVTTRDIYFISFEDASNV